MYPDRQWLTLNEARGEALKDNTKTLTHYKVKDGDVLYFKDLGAQVSWRTVFIVEYFGPLAIFAMLYFCPCVYGEQGKGRVLNWTQHAGFVMVALHYLKRELETIFVHRFSNSTMPFKRIFINSGHYWVTCGTLIGYFFFHPKHTEPGLS